MSEGGPGVFLCRQCASLMPPAGSKWWRRVGTSFEGPWFVQEVSHVVKLYLPNPLSPCGAFHYVTLASWPAGYIGAVS